MNRNPYLPPLNSDQIIFMKQSYLHSFCLTLAIVLFSGFSPPVSAQSSQHLQSFDISPLQKGEFLLMAKKPGEALAIFKDLWQKEPQNSYAVRGIVRSYQALEKLPEAMALLNGYLEKHPQSSSAAYGFGYAFYLQGKYKESRDVLNEALSFDRKNVLALNNLSVVEAEFKEYPSALKKVKEAISLAPSELMFYRNLQMIYASSGKADKFEEEYRHLLAEGSPEKARGYGLVLAQLLRQKSFKLYADGKIDGSIKAITGMLDLYREVNHKPGIVAALFSLAVLYEEQGKLKQALEKYRDVLKINPQHIQSQEKERFLGSKKDLQ
jgi:tetratricopeptide (TPR) repeat protein